MKYIVQGIKDVLRKKIKDCSGDLILLAASRSWEVIGPLALHLDDFMQADRRIIVLLDSRKNHGTPYSLRSCIVIILIVSQKRRFWNALSRQTRK